MWGVTPAGAPLRGLVHVFKRSALLAWKRVGGAGVDQHVCSAVTLCAGGMTSPGLFAGTRACIDRVVWGGRYGGG